MRRMLVLALILGAAVAWTTTAHSQGSTASVVDQLKAIDAQLAGKSSLTPSQRSAVHAAKAALLRGQYTATERGVSYATLIGALDCVDTQLQIARAAKTRSAAKQRIARAKSCHASLSTKLKGAPASTRADLKAIGTRIAAVAAAARAGKAFGSKATALRKLAATFVAKRFKGNPVGSVSAGETFADLECIDVKIEAGRVSGASACARRLIRLLGAGSSGETGTTTTPPPAAQPLTFGSDLAGDPVAIAGSYQDDTEFWTDGVTVPADGIVTKVTLKVGSDPVELPLRISVVRPQGDGTVKVITTSDPPYTLPANAPGTYDFETAGLKFVCCKAQKGDIVTIDNKGTTAPDPYVWFARRDGFSTFSHTQGGASQDPGMIWTGVPHPGFELLMRVVLQPG